MVTFEKVKKPICPECKTGRGVRATSTDPNLVVCTVCKHEWRVV